MRITDVQRAVAACRASFATIVLFSFCINLLALASPLYLIHVYDHVLSSRSLDTLAMLTLMVLAALMVLGALEALRREILGRIGMWLDDRLQDTVLAAAFNAALRNEGAAAAQGWRDLGSMRTFLAGPAMTPLLDAPWSPIFILALFLIDPLIGTVGVVGALVLFALAVANESLTRRPLAEASVAWLRSQHRLEAMLRNAEVIRAMGMLDGARRALREDQDAAKSAQGIAGRRSALVLAFSRFVRSSVQIAVMCAATWLVLREGLSPGGIFASSILLSRALVPVENAIGTWRNFTAVRLAYHRLVKLASQGERPAHPMALPRPQGALTLERVSFVPPGSDAPTLRRVSLTLAPGEVLGIVGPSGAGKSTLGRLIAGTWLPSAGHVRLDGADISVWLASGGSRFLGYLPQDIELFDGSIRDNIARLQDASSEDVIAAAKLVGMHEAVMSLPNAYHCEIGEAGLRLSGGQRQRIGLARAFFGEPQLVVLDEPNASLDAEGEEALYRAIEHMKASGTTIVVIAHRARLLNVADKLLVLRNGAVDLFGERAEIAHRLKLGRDGGAAKERPTIRAASGA
jgi:PrtD family type I secretion system ABC transporter